MARLTKATGFPTPDQFSRKVVVGKSPLWLKAALGVGSFLLVALSIWIAAGVRGQMTSWELFVKALIAIAISLLLHELLHLAAHPGFGVTPTSKIGFGMVGRKPAIWVGYAGRVSRGRAILILVLPFLVLGFIPSLVALLIDDGAGSWLAAIGAANVLASHNDLKTALAIGQSSASSVFDAESGFYEL